MMGTKLLPCPKCNGKAALNEGPYDFDGGGRYYAFSAEFECLECGLLFRVHNDHPIKYVEHDAMWDFAIEAWNTRTYFEGEVMLMGNRVFISGHGHYAKERTCEIEFDLPQEVGFKQIDCHCSECWHGMSVHDNYCAECGAKVID